MRNHFVHEWPRLYVIPLYATNRQPPQRRFYADSVKSLRSNAAEVTYCSWPSLRHFHFSRPEPFRRSRSEGFLFRIAETRFFFCRFLLRTALIAPLRQRRSHRLLTAR